ncbi:methylated-DNA--[protein]-cysteine S-methyltransferase [Cumulibacter soli]|uniref:methylated-DNA--[protein]-cysteine S-methyltransferase n=1 Tax=Cumulibacter soli TaxID=2546344 RepID=UPI0010672BF8|nr:methylated-DNA--[protein]-cysteine S-methyltransferase [Cumulibacter soli]
MSSTTQAALYWGSLDSPVGHVAVASDGVAIVQVAWSEHAPMDHPTDPLLTEALAQLSAYFDGSLTKFDLPLGLASVSDSARGVLHTLHATVQFGESVTYGELASRAQTGADARGVGSIMGSNPLPLVIPCHRVMASDGLGGYSGGTRGNGLETKRWLLEFEGALPPTLF